MRPLAILGALAACKAAVTTPPTSPVPAPTPASVSAAPDPFAGYNLGFEAVDGDRPKGWMGEVPGYEVRADGDVAHGGARSLRIRQTAEARFLPLAIQLDPEPLAGKRLRISGWIKTSGATGQGAALWSRADVDGGEHALANMGDGMITGDRAWTAASIELIVPEKATRVIVGTMLAGGGTAWFDDLRIEVLPAPVRVPITLAGHVVDPAGAPVAGAEVGLIDSSQNLETHVTTDAGGRFTFEAKSGRWGLSAVAKSHVAGFLPQAEYARERRDLRIALGRDGVTIRGKVSPAPASSFFVELSATSKHDADVWAIPVVGGAFAIEVPRADQYLVNTTDRSLGASKVIHRNGDVIDVELALPAPAPEAVVAHIAKHAFALATAEPGSGIADLAPLGKLVGKARIVALGEATHGTREFFQLKHRVLEYLVEKQGFTLFALEANQPECRAINDYVLHGKGTARAALAGVYFAVWQTEEVLALIEWMRAWNADPDHRKVQFVGYDMQTSKVAYATVAELVRRVAADRAEALLAPIAVLADAGAMDLVGKLDAGARAKLTAGLDRIAATFDAERAAWVRASSATAFTDARHDVEILRQATRMYFADLANDYKAGFDVRDLAMADNIGWLLDQNPRARMVVWAHNGHVANEMKPFVNMGSHLRARYRRDYVNLGFLWGEGAFQASAIEKGKLTSQMFEFSLGPPPATHASAPFSKPGKPLLVLDLRSLPAGPVREWFHAPHAVREAGAGFFSERGMTAQAVLPALYDAIIYVDKTSRARPLGTPSK